MRSLLPGQRVALAACALVLGACGAGPSHVIGTVDDGHSDVEVERGPAPRESPPASGAARDVSFPPIADASLENGLALSSVEWRQLPIVYLRLVIKSGAEADPPAQPGLSHLVGQILEEGTRRRTSAQLAEEVDYLGADLWVESDEENVYVGMRALSEHLDQAMAILADVATAPAFSPSEIAKLKRRELDRLALQSNDPGFLATREMYRALYGEHPYARIDTTREVVERLRRADLQRWHRTHFVPNNAVLVAVGSVSADEVRDAASRHFGAWRRGTVPTPTYAAAPARDRREVIVVDRRESVQSVIGIGNLAVERASEDWVPLVVANQVLGGSAASRLFMDLRERRSLTYGAYSGVGESVGVAPFRARASVRNEVTGEAVEAFFEHLGRITTEPVPAEELADARRYLSDRFPLEIDTPGKIAGLVADLRVFGLPNDYWDGYRSAIRATTAEQALAAARRYVTPQSAVVVVVGKADEIVEPLRRWGPVTVLDTNGAVQARHEAVASADR